MSEYVYECPKHGDLTIEEVYQRSSGKYRCKACFKAARDAHYQRNKDKILAMQRMRALSDPEKRREEKRRSERKHREKHRERVAVTNKRYRENNKEKLRAKDNEKKWFYRETLHPVYVRQNLVNGSNLSASDIPDSLVRFETEKLAIKRVLRKKKSKDIERSFKGLLDEQD